MTRKRTRETRKRTREYQLRSKAKCCGLKLVRHYDRPPSWLRGTTLGNDNDCFALIDPVTRKTVDPSRREGGTHFFPHEGFVYAWTLDQIEDFLKFANRDLILQAMLKATTLNINGENEL
jgi:hypothetical protein